MPAHTVVLRRNERREGAPEPRRIKVSAKLSPEISVSKKAIQKRILRKKATETTKQLRKAVEKNKRESAKRIKKSLDQKQSQVVLDNEDQQEKVPSQGDVQENQNNSNATETPELVPSRSPNHTSSSVKNKSPEIDVSEDAQSETLSEANVEKTKKEELHALAAAEVSPVTQGDSLSSAEKNQTNINVSPDAQHANCLLVTNQVTAAIEEVSLESTGEPWMSEETEPNESETNEELPPGSTDHESSLEIVGDVSSQKFGSSPQKQKTKINSTQQNALNDKENCHGRKCEHEQEIVHLTEKVSMLEGTVKGLCGRMDRTENILKDVNQNITALRTETVRQSPGTEKPGRSSETQVVKVMDKYVEKLKLADALAACKMSSATKHLAIGYLGSEKVMTMKGKKTDSQTEIIDTLKLRTIYNIIVFLWGKKKFAFQVNTEDPYARDPKKKSTSRAVEVSQIEGDVIQQDDEVSETHKDIPQATDVVPVTKFKKNPSPFPWSFDEIKSFALNGLKKHRNTVKRTKA